MRPLIRKWRIKLLDLGEPVISEYRNSQNRTIRQIVGHMIDSASNNTHRIIHLHYGSSPCVFPDYANLGNNDRWIAIQNYQEENWEDLVEFWNYAHLHILHVILQIDHEKLDQIWISALNKQITLKAMVMDFPRHFGLHLGEIDDLILSNG